MKPDAAVLFAVEDNGIGIKKEHHESIFNRFFQVDSNSCVSGDGIGLAFVKHLVELHEGIILGRERAADGLYV